MITDVDIKKLAGKFATKLDLAKLEIKLEDRINKMEEKMATKDDFRKVMTILDKVLKEVLAVRQEQSMHVGAHMRIDERLHAIEHTPTVAHELRRKNKP